MNLSSDRTEEPGSDRPAVTGLANIVVHVRDVEASTAFYRDLLGFEVMFDSGWTTNPDMLALSGTAPGTRMRLSRLGISGTPDGITLCAFEGFGETVPSPFEQSGTVHFGVVVADLRNHLERLASRGVTVLGPPTELGPPDRRSLLALVRDPDGVVVELVQHGVGAPRPHEASPARGASA